MSSLPRHEADRLRRSAEGRRFADLVARRQAGAPLQYLEGSAPFGPLELIVDERVLIPRPETEQLFSMAAGALGEAGPGTTIVDLCTGSGALALALKHRFPTARVMATDLSSEALVVARENSARLGLEVEWRHGDLFGALPREIEGRVDLLVANPPYVAEDEWDLLPVDVRHEPRSALVAGVTGREIIDRIAGEAYWWLGIGGWLFCEIGETQGGHAIATFGEWLDVDLRRDLGGKDRFLVGRKGARCCV